MIEFSPFTSLIYTLLLSLQYEIRSRVREEQSCQDCSVEQINFDQKGVFSEIIGKFLKWIFFYDIKLLIFFMWLAISGLLWNVFEVFKELSLELKGRVLKSQVVNSTILISHRKSIRLKLSLQFSLLCFLGSLLN